ncbi:MAG: phosphate ABC transporter permease subunit PstC [Nitrospirae bacterium]|jgi:phosphate transport system permease protein|uniref:Phosphate transport system permease protein n=1 Tax=Leptospirillum ferrodiazotrophum TaxID=412449 RepID=C6HXQ5_9BACT|nr:MAG: phosphate ABC transporter, permease protein (PstC) [Leptospirillum ferrodiazotrophum]MCL5953601.1 phosphate ABC transporter permease subunit PstC [Nitrospirota bacterium]
MAAPEHEQGDSLLSQGDHRPPVVAPLSFLAPDPDETLEEQALARSAPPTETTLKNLRRASHSQILRSERLFHLTLRLGGLFILLLFAIVLGVSVVEAWPSIEKFGWSFLWTSTWNPHRHIFGAWTYLVGTFWVTGIALIFAIPIAILSALFLSDYAPKWLVGGVSTLMEMLAGIPSIVFGAFGIIFVVPLMRDHVEPFLANTLGRHFDFFSGDAMGYGILSAGLVVGIMVIPLVATVTRDSLVMVPRETVEAAYALGSTKAEMVYFVKLPAVVPGIIGSVILGFGRALGETMAVLLLIGNQASVPTSIQDVGYTISSLLANTFTYAVIDPLFSAAEIELGLILLVISLVVNTLGRELLLKLMGGRLAGSVGGG